MSVNSETKFFNDFINQSFIIELLRTRYFYINLINLIKFISNLFIKQLKKKKIGKYLKTMNLKFLFRKNK